MNQPAQAGTLPVTIHVSIRPMKGDPNDLPTWLRQVSPDAVLLVLSYVPTGLAHPGASYGEFLIYTKELGFVTVPVEYCRLMHLDPFAKVYYEDGTPAPSRTKDWVLV